MYMYMDLILKIRDDYLMFFYFNFFWDYFYFIMNKKILNFDS